MEKLSLEISNAISDEFEIKDVESLENAVLCVRDMIGRLDLVSFGITENEHITDEQIKETWMEYAADAGLLDEKMRNSFGRDSYNEAISDIMKFLDDKKGALLTLQPSKLYSMVRREVKQMMR